MKDETGIPLHRASSFAILLRTTCFGGQEASSFAKATKDKTEDKTEDKLIRARGFMICSLWPDVLEYIRGGWLVEARLELRLDKDVVDIDTYVSRVEP